jgi:hypothetical protein
MKRKYTGPAKPIPTVHIHPVDNRVGKALFLLALIAVLTLDLFVWRP